MIQPAKPHGSVAPAAPPVSLPTPQQLSDTYPLSSAAKERITQTRQQICERLKGAKTRQVIVVGPCSIHSEQAALNYAEKLAPLARRLNDDLLIVMRAYFEKPRTTVGWKGFLYDPALDGSHDLALGLKRSRALLVELAEMGLPLATELLDPLTCSFFQDALSWVAIGARTSESQIHRQAVSGLPCPAGFKNATDGSLHGALAAMQAAASPHAHLGVNSDGQLTIVQTAGNAATHLVLRGGRTGPNYSRESIDALAKEHGANDAPLRLMVDCSHGNSGKDPQLQMVVARHMLAQPPRADVDLIGLMIESHVREGRQACRPQARPDVSVTDPCLGFAATAKLLEELAKGARNSLRQQRPLGSGAGRVAFHSSGTRSPQVRQTP